jgi:hypothetical protein
MAVANNIVVDYDTATFTAVKGLILQAPEANPTDLFWS